MSYLDKDDSEDRAIAPVRVPLFLAASLPVLVIATLGVINDYMATGAAEKRAWLLLFFPVLCWVALKPWLLIAVPVAFTCASRNMAARTAIGLLAALATFAASFMFVHDRSYPYGPTVAGSMSFAAFALGIWLLNGGVALVLALSKRGGPEPID